jgi:hypothetical protein
LVKDAAAVYAVAYFFFIYFRVGWADVKIFCVGGIGKVTPHLTLSSRLR